MAVKLYMSSKNRKGFHVGCETKNGSRTRLSSKLGKILGFKKLFCNIHEGLQFIKRSHLPKNCFLNTLLLIVLGFLVN